jgi:fructose-specific phosphotransferase system component IIB
VLDIKFKTEQNGSVGLENKLNNKQNGHVRLEN